MTAPRPITDEVLHAYADGQLPSAERAAVKAWLADHPTEAATVESWQRQNEALNALFGPVAEEPIPSRLGPQLIAARRQPPATGWMSLAAAAAVLVIISGAAGWFGRDVLNAAPAPSDLLIDSAVTAHALYVKENRHAVEVAATEEPHLVTWLSNRLATPIQPPDLTAEGFTLVGGRLLPSGIGEQPGPAAQLMYENSTAERVTVYITAALPDGATTSEFVTRAGLDAFYWANNTITCTVVGDLPPDTMQMVARKVYQQLTWRPDADYHPGG